MATTPRPRGPVQMTHGQVDTGGMRMTPRRVWALALFAMLLLAVSIWLLLLPFSSETKKVEIELREIFADVGLGFVSVSATGDLVACFEGENDNIVIFATNTSKI